jgi:peroxiredoxin
MGLAVGAMLAAAAASSPVPDLELRDTSGVTVRLSADPARATVVVFLGTACPLANLYAPRVKALAGRFPPGAVRVLAVSTDAGDDPAAAAAFAATHSFPFPYLHDPDGRAAAALGATRTPEAVLLDAGRRVRYRGRIDDQYAPGGRRAAPSREDLAEAVAEVLAGKAVSVPRTTSVGCAVARPRAAPAHPPVTYGRDIAPLLARRCLPCHRPGEIGPFPLTTFAAARSHAATIAEVVEAGTMPPWHAAAGVGRFRNDRRLTPAEKRLVTDWVRLGCPEGDPAPPAAVPPSTGWEVGVPDAVYPIPAAFAVPAEGVVEYQYFVVDPGFTADTWVRAAEVRPGNRRVVHHCTVFLTPPAAADPGREAFETGGPGAACLVTFTPGCGPVRLTDGLAKCVPAGWRFLFVVHYSPVGTPQTDRTELGLQFLPADEVRRQVETVLLVDPGLTIPPHAAAHRVERTWTADRDYLLLSMFPHMHLRGKSFRYTAEYPGGRPRCSSTCPPTTSTGSTGTTWRSRSGCPRGPWCGVPRCTTTRPPTRSTRTRGRRYAPGSRAGSGCSTGTSTSPPPTRTGRPNGPRPRPGGRGPRAYSSPPCSPPCCGPGGSSAGPVPGPCRRRDPRPYPTSSTATTVTSSPTGCVPQKRRKSSTTAAVSRSAGAAACSRKAAVSRSVPNVSPISLRASISPSV